MVPKTRLIGCWNVFKARVKMISFIKNAMELTAEYPTLGKVKIQRDISQGEVLSPQLFVIAMIPLNHMLSDCTGVRLHIFRNKVKY